MAMMSSPAQRNKALSLVSPSVSPLSDWSACVKAVFLIGQSSRTFKGGSVVLCIKEQRQSCKPLLLFSDPFLDYIAAFCLHQPAPGERP